MKHAGTANCCRGKSMMLMQNQLPRDAGFAIVRTKVMNIWSVLKLTSCNACDLGRFTMLLDYIESCVCKDHAYVSIAMST